MRNVALNTILRRASVTGDFDPLKILQDAGFDEKNAEEYDQLLAALSLRCTEKTQSGQYRWRLDGDSRRDFFSQLTSRQMLKDIISTAPKPVKGDLFGIALGQILRGKRTLKVSKKTTETKGDFTERKFETLAAQFDAAQFAAIIPAINDLNLDELAEYTAGEIQQLQRKRDISIVLPDALFGRVKTKTRLSRFLRGKTNDTRPLLVTGIGGVGKSALIASLLDRWHRRKGAPVCIVLDFDRPQLSTGAPVKIMREFLRQLSTEVALREGLAESQKSIIGAELEAIRSDLPDLTTDGSSRDFESQLGRMRELTFIRFGEEWANTLRDIPIALLLDSFEAVDRQGGETVLQIMRLERNLRDHGLAGLRSLVSGRAPPLDEQDSEEFFGNPSRRIDLKGLDKVAGGQLLQSRDKPPKVFRNKHQRERASEAVGGHPLAIIVLARYARDHTGNVNTLIDDLNSDQNFKAEFAQVFLYKRILERISDDDVRNLAHPGLVLRMINQDLIRDVLAKTCLGIDIDAARASVLFQKLQDEYWLVEDNPEQDGIRHRADLRSQMLPGLFAGPRKNDSDQERDNKQDLRKRAIDTCRAAARFFRSRNKPSAPIWLQEMDKETCWVEAAYYDALVGKKPRRLTKAKAELLFDRLGQNDFDTLPVEWIAQIKTLKGERVSDVEMETLSDELLEVAESTDFGFTQMRGSSKIGAAEKIQRKSPRRKRKLTFLQLGRKVTQHFSQAEFEKLDDVVSLFLEALQNTNSKDREKFEELLTKDYWDSPAWQIVLRLSLDPSVLKILEGSHDKIAEPPDRAQVFVSHFFRQLRVETGEPGGLLLGEFRLPDLQQGIGRHRINIRGWRFSQFNQTKKMYIQPRRIDLNALSLTASPVVDKLSRDDLKGVVPTELQNEIQILSKQILRSYPVKLIQIVNIYQICRRLRDDHPYIESLMVKNEEVSRDILRGLSPDLYRPIRSVLENPEIPLSTVIVTTLSLKAPYWPMELTSKELHKSKVPENIEIAASVVETADQCGVLRDLLVVLEDYDQRAAILKQMYDAITDWFFEPSLQNPNAQ